jgi:hypothetical protein
MLRAYRPFSGNEYDGKEFDGYLGRDVILVCCSWGEELADGELTYFIGENIIKQGGNGNGEKVDRGSIKAINGAIQDWDSRIVRLTFTETTLRKTKC